MNEPEEGECSTDRFIMAGQNPSNSIPVICGHNDNQHGMINPQKCRISLVPHSRYCNKLKALFVTSVYVEYQSHSSVASLNALLLHKGIRMWVIRVSFIPCDSLFKAPASCLQYVSGVTGEITSFNYRTASTETNSSGYYVS
jgi:hypothetical protein